MDLHALFHIHELQTGADRRMLDGIFLGCVFDARVSNSAGQLEKRRRPGHGDLAILVDCCGQNGTAMLAIPDWIVSAADEKRNTKRCASDYHVVLIRPIWQG